MRWGRIACQVVGFLVITGMVSGVSHAQFPRRFGQAYRSAPYGRAWSGYPPPGYFNRMGRYPFPPRGAQTVVDYRPLIRAITSLPGWNAPPARSQRQPRSLPAMPRAELLTADGKIQWPAETPGDSRLVPARHAAEEAVELVAREYATYGQSTIRHVMDARNRLTAFARQSLPTLKARDKAVADQLERFIVELQKDLATMTKQY
jgi:hypothetical protein